MIAIEIVSDASATDAPALVHRVVRVMFVCSHQVASTRGA
jgi:hypothetical protein